jgi:hypothetical protein
MDELSFTHGQTHGTLLFGLFWIYLHSKSSLQEGETGGVPEQEWWGRPELARGGRSRNTLPLDFYLPARLLSLYFFRKESDFLSA